MNRWKLINENPVAMEWKAKTVVEWKSIALGLRHEIGFKMEGVVADETRVHGLNNAF